MMRRIPILFFLLLSLLLGGCSQPVQASAVPTVPVTEPAATETAPLPPAAEETLPPAAVPTAAAEAPLTADPRTLAFYHGIDPNAPEMLAYDAVIHGNQKLVVPATGKNATLYNYLKWHDGQTPLTIRQMTVVDLDQDGALELILWTALGSDDCFGFEVLRHHAGQVYVYNLTDQAFQQLKIDGTSRIVSTNSGFGFGGYVFDEQAPWGSVPEQLYAHNSPEAQAAEARHNEKADILWLPSWEELIYPGVPQISDVVVGINQIPDILSGKASMTDTATQQRYTIDQAKQLLVPEDVPAYVARYAAVDMDSDGTKEAILRIHNAKTDEPIGFVIVNQQGCAEAFYYRFFRDLKTDGSYQFSSGASSYGFARKSFDGSRWQESILAECYPTTMEAQQESIVYFVNGHYATPEDFSAYEANQNTKKNAVWYDTWEACQAAE